MNKLLTLILVLSAFVSIGQTPMRSGLVGYWKMETTSFLDETNSSYDGTNSGVTIVTGKINNCGQFDGSDYVSINSGATVAGMDAITISAWVYETTRGASPKIYDEATSEAGNISRIRLESFNGVIRLKWRDSSQDPNGTVSTLTGSTISLNTWHHIIGVYDSENNSQQIYIDGDLDVSSTDAVSSFGTSTTLGINIGDTEFHTQGFTGSLDEVILHRRAISALEAKLLYNSGTGLLFVMDNWINKKITDEQFADYYWDYLKTNP